MPRLAGKVAIVTGGARGLGAAAAESLCADGAEVWITDLLEERGAETAKTLNAKGWKAHFLCQDVTDAARWKDIVDEVTRGSGGVDILVNNAGVTTGATIESATLDAFRRMIEINLFGTFLGMQAVIPAMKARGGGAIVNISSNSASKIVAVASIYSASKAAVANLTKTAAVHCAESGYNIRINSIHPGPHATDMLMAGEKGAELPEVRRMIEAIPMKRMGEPRDIGPVVAFLASDDSRYMTAAEIYVDGGVSPV